MLVVPSKTKSIPRSLSEAEVRDIEDEKENKQTNGNEKNNNPMDKGKRNKTTPIFTRLILPILFCIIVPFLYFVALSTLQWEWFDIREWRQDPEGEIPYIAEWKYSAFYAVMIAMSVLQAFLICIYFAKNKFRSWYQPLIMLLITCIVLFIWVITTEVFLLTLPFREIPIWWW